MFLHFEEFGDYTAKMIIWKHKKMFHGYEDVSNRQWWQMQINDMSTAQNFSKQWTIPHILATTTMIDS